MMGVLTSDLFIQLTTTLAHLSNMTLNTSEMSLGGEIDNETLAGRRQWQYIKLHTVAQFILLVLLISLMKLNEGSGKFCIVW